MNQASLIEALTHGIIPAVPVPFSKDGSIHHASQQSYIEFMRRQPIAGVAVWAHTGRGLHLTTDQREYVLKSWRDALPDKIIVAGVGGNPNASTNEEYMSSAVAMSEHAAKGGADAFLVYPPTRARTMSSGDAEQFIYQYHKAIAASGVPLILFYLYEAAGGVNYFDAVIEHLAAKKPVIGMKLATADSVMTYQRIAALFAEKFPEKLLITGEDRFFGYSMMMGAHAALVGMGSALTGLQAAMMNAYYYEAQGVAIPSHPETDRYKDKSFMELSALVDQLGFATFAEPLQGYIQRMLWVLVELEVIAEDGAFDPWGPMLGEEDRMFVRRILRALL